MIKGSKQKIYHLPGSQYYTKTTSPIRMFKTEVEAYKAGFRPAK
ncbi:sunset domain-containing protein [Enterococcus casseliflavus]